MQEPTKEQLVNEAHAEMPNHFGQGWGVEAVTDLAKKVKERWGDDLQAFDAYLGDPGVEEAARRDFFPGMTFPQRDVQGYGVCSSLKARRALELARPMAFARPDGEMLVLLFGEAMKMGAQWRWVLPAAAKALEGRLLHPDLEGEVADCLRYVQANVASYAAPESVEV
jgi:hypothetical protein